MSKKNPRVFAQSNLPVRLPVGWGIVYYLLLDRFSAPGWMWGAVGVFYVMLFAGCLIRMCREVAVDHFNNGN